MDPDFQVRALLKAFVLPPGSILLLLLAALLLWRRVAGRVLAGMAFALLLVLSLPVTTGWLGRMVETVPALDTAAAEAANAAFILVLMADRRSDNPELGGADALSAMSVERLAYALRLQRATGLPLLPSGGALRDDERPLARLAEDWLRANGDAPLAAVEDRSHTTWENLAFSGELLQGRRVLLVTHAFHMPRALLAARAHGVDAIGAPFAFMHRPTGPPQVLDWIPSSYALQRSYLLLHELLGTQWYRLRETFA